MIELALGNEEAGRERIERNLLRKVIVQIIDQRVFQRGIGAAAGNGILRFDAGQFMPKKAL